MFFEEELQLFRKIAPFTFYDNSFDEFSGETVLDHYLISHADFLDLFTKYGVKGNEILLDITCIDSIQQSKVKNKNSY